MAKRVIDTAEGDIDSDSLCTPPDICQAVYDLWGRRPHCDPATNDHAIMQADRMYTSGGLIKPWGKTTFLNHPYSDNDPWSKKALSEMKAGRVHELVILCMTATSTAWWRRLMTQSRRNPRVLCTKRIPFYGPNGKPLASGARFDTSLIYYGAKVKRFDKLFSPWAMWSTWGR